MGFSRPSQRNWRTPSAATAFAVSRPTKSQHRVKAFNLFNPGMVVFN